MALDIGSEDIGTLSIKERTTEIVIRTPLGADPHISVTREKVWIMPDGVTAVKREGVRQVQRNASAILAQSFTAAGATVTGAQLAALIAAAADTWRQEDVATEQASEEG
jgi:hypothetical protein